MQARVMLNVESWISRFSSSTVVRMGMMVSRSLIANPHRLKHSSGGGILSQ
jgi:hypothetical protein